MSEQQRKIYQTDGDRYEALIAREDYQGNIEKTLDEIVNADGLDVLDLGAGTGRLAVMLAPRAKSMRAFDVSEEMLRVAAARVNGAHSGRIALRRMDAEAMDFADASFDCVTLPYVLSVTPDPDRLIAEVRRVCRRGGDILIVNHFSGGRFWRPVEHVLRPLAAKIGFRSEFSFERYIAAQDWTVLSSRSTNLFALSRLVHVRND